MGRVFHNAHVHYETDWMPTSRGAAPEQIDAGWSAQSRKGLAEIDPDGQRRVSPDGLTLRARTDRRRAALRSASLAFGAQNEHHLCFGCCQSVGALGGRLAHVLIVWRYSCRGCRNWMDHCS